jgi:hypothetical protein
MKVLTQWIMTDCNTMVWLAATCGLGTVSGRLPWHSTLAITLSNALKHIDLLALDAASFVGLMPHVTLELLRAH